MRALVRNCRRQHKLFYSLANVATIKKRIFVAAAADKRFFLILTPLRQIIGGLKNKQKCEAIGALAAAAWRTATEIRERARACAQTLAAAR